MFLISPYFDHDTYMHHTMHVLDALACSLVEINSVLNAFRKRILSYCERSLCCNISPSVCRDRGPSIKYVTLEGEGSEKV